MSALRPLDHDLVDAWLEFDPEGILTVYAGKVELGTGIQTALAQIVAEELDVPLDRVRMVLGDTARTPDQGTTAGSKTIQGAGPVLRQAAAEARRILLHRAAARLGAPVDSLTVENGTIRAPTGAEVTYGDLAGGQPFREEITGTAPLKPRERYTVVGTSAPRLDLRAKLTGGPAFVHDVTLPGMLHGRVIRPHRRTPAGIGGHLERVDDSALDGLPGIVAVVRNGSFVGVVAEREEQAIAAAAALQVTWRDLPDLPRHENEHDRLRAAPADTVEAARHGDPARVLRDAPITHAATYRQPWQAHATMGPSCAVADVRDGHATIYASTQSVTGLAAAIAPLLRLPPNQVRVIYHEGAGCYGHSGSDDVAADAALLAQAVGKPVRVQWSRQNEFAWEPKGPAMLTDLRAALDPTGAIAAWEAEVYTPTHSARPNGEPSRLLAGQQVEPPFPPAPSGWRGGGDRNAVTTYDLPTQAVTIHWTGDPPIRQSSLRSLGGFHNTTANEGFIDELAHRAGADPIAYRKRHLTDPRAWDVLDEVARISGWAARLTAQAAQPLSLPSHGGGELLTGRGVAFVRYETEWTYVATVAEVEVNPATGDILVRHVWVAHDCGQVVNPDGVRNQVEGNILQGLSRALKEEVTWDAHGLTSLTWAGYPILTFPEVPELSISLVDRPEEPAWGAGEPAICTAAAAVANAVFNATGARLRTIPYTPARVLEALREARSDTP